jgi:hypothetical protein
MIKGIISLIGISFISFFLLIVDNNCNRKKNYEKQKKYTIESSLDSLNYVNLPGLSQAKWIVTSMGRQESRVSIGPTDYQFCLYSEQLPDVVEDFIKKNLTILSDLNSVPVEKDIYNALGGQIKYVNEIDDDKYLFNGIVYDASPIIRYMQNGVLVVNGSALLIRATSF